MADLRPNLPAGAQAHQANARWTTSGFTNILRKTGGTPVIRLFAAALGLLLACGAAEARNTPCSQGKGGIKACQGTKYLCNNGTISASKYPCTGRGEIGASDDGAGGGMGSSRKGRKGKR